LHALKDYWGMVQCWAKLPASTHIQRRARIGHAAEEYASGKFNEPWFALAFKPTDELTREDKAEILARAFQLNHDRLMSRWPRFVELFEWSRPAVRAGPGDFTPARLARPAGAFTGCLDG